MFLRPYRDITKIREARGLFLAWWPFAVIGFDSCSNNYLVDLVVASEITDPLPLILTMRRYRDKNPVEPSPSIEAPIMIPRSVGPNTILDMLYKVKREIDARRDRENPVRERWPRGYRQQILVRRPNTLEDALSNPVSRGILSEILSSICINSYSVRITTYRPVHVLVGVKRDMKEFSIFIDKKIRSVNHEIYVLSNENIRSLIGSYMKLSVQGE